MSLTDIYNTLNELDLGKKSIQRLAHLVQNNTDRSCLMNGGLLPMFEVSPVITGRMGTKQITKAFKTIGLYNLVLESYNEYDKVWHFCAFTNRCKLLRISVKRNEFNKPITYIDAVAVAFVRCQERISQMKVDEDTHTTFIASEIELEPLNHVHEKLSELTNIACAT